MQEILVSNKLMKELHDSIHVTPSLLLGSSNSTLTANFSSASKTFYFRANGNGTVSHSSVTYKPGDAPVIVTATPESGCSFNYWEIIDDEMGMAEYYSSSKTIVVNDDFCNNPVVYNGCILQASFSGALTNLIKISNVTYMGWGLQATVTSQYTLDENVYVDFEGTYDYAYETGGTGGIEKNVYDANRDILLSKGKRTWIISVDFRYDEATGAGTTAAKIENIRWEFAGRTVTTSKYENQVQSDNGQLK